ncbi:long-chain fatty acid-CoA ligase [Massospora cicadina]|nr:long-chain fatty acid-CoA ligase [Massospora cicadina]
MKYLYEVVPSAKEGESAIYRSRMVQENGRLLQNDPQNGATTLYELLKHSASEYSTQPAFGYREVVETYKEDIVSNGATKKFTYHKFSDYRWMSFLELDETLVLLSKALNHIGLKAQDKATFYAPSTYRWMALAYAMTYRRVVVATVYDTLGEEGLLHGLNQCESPALYLTADQFPLLRRLHGRTTHLKVILYSGKVTEGMDLIAEFPNFKCYSWDELLEMGRANPVDPDPPRPEDLAVIMYTSGSTGPPKGAMLTHSQLVAHVAGIRQLTAGMILQQDKIISFLPLAHILAFILTTFCVASGIRVGFATPRTLMDSGVRNCRGDLNALRPTLLPGVPQVFDTIRKDVLNKMEGAGAGMRLAFYAAMALKRVCLKFGFHTGWLDRIFFAKLSQATGGCLRMGVCGGAPLSGQVADFFETTMFPIFQGYGMTEMCGLGSIVHSTSDMPRSSVGQINPAFELKLVDVPDAGYFATDGVGELWVRGPSVSSGYFKNPEATGEAITSDGWLRTGDIVSLDGDGCLTIIDRRKNLVKLCNGEYIAVEKLESIYRNSLYVQAICLFADSYLRRPVAIPPRPRQLRRRQRPPTPLDLADASGNPQFTQAVFQSLMAEAKKLNLNPSEKLAAVFLSGEEFTPQTKLLTPSQKLNRRAIQARFKKELETLFKAAR